MENFGDVGVEIHGHVALLEIQRGPNNFFDVDLINSLGDAFDAMDDNPDIRALVLAAEGKHFCAGANFGSRDQQAERSQRTETSGNPLYTAAVRLFRAKKPVVAPSRGPQWAAASGLPSCPTSAWCALRRASRPTS